MFKKYLEAIYNDISSTIRIDDEDVLKVCRDIFRDDILMEWMVIWYNELLVLKFLRHYSSLHAMQPKVWPVDQTNTRKRSSSKLSLAKTPSFERYNNNYVSEKVLEDNLKLSSS